MDILLRLRTACVDPSSIPAGFAAPCPVLTATPAAVTAAAPDGVVALILPTFFVFDSGQWQAIPVRGVNGWCFRACSAALPHLAPGVHGVASWDWSWNGSCWVGPGSSTCGQGNWRYQTVTIP